MYKNLQKKAFTLLILSLLMLMTSTASFEADHHHGHCNHHHCSTCAMIEMGDMVSNQILNDDNLKMIIILSFFIGLLKSLDRIYISKSLISLKIRLDC